MLEFGQLYRAGSVERYHTVRTHHRQTLADHSWGVAMVLLKIKPSVGADVLKAALVHDLAESVTGDVPFPVKRDYPKLADALRAVELEFNKRHELTDLAGADLTLLKWADMAELCLFTQYEILMGNAELLPVYQRGISHLIQLGFPTREAYDLFNDQFVPEDV